MLHLKLSEVQAGMVLGQDVFGIHGQMLLGSGATLTSRHLDMLQANRVQHLYIDIAMPVVKPATKLDPAEIDALLDSKFHFCDEQQPLMHELRRLSRNRLTRTQGKTE